MTAGSCRGCALAGAVDHSVQITTRVPAGRACPGRRRAGRVEPVAHGQGGSRRRSSGDGASGHRHSGQVGAACHGEQPSRSLRRCGAVSVGGRAGLTTGSTATSGYAGVGRRFSGRPEAPGGGVGGHEMRRPPCRSQDQSGKSPKLGCRLTLGGKVRPVGWTWGGCSALAYRIPPRVVAVVASIGFTGWVGRVVGCSVALGVASG
jgi:hypothetical protein